jgi:type 1 fimbria pilin
MTITYFTLPRMSRARVASICAWFLGSFLIGLLFPQSAYAASNCGLDSGAPAAFTFAPATVTVASNTPVGTVLATSSSTIVLRCTGIGNGNKDGRAILMVDLSQSAPLNATDPSIIPTNVSGIGIKLTSNGPTTLGTNTTTPELNKSNWTSNGIVTNYSTTVTAQLVVTGSPIASGSVAGNAKGSATLGAYTWKQEDTSGTISSSTAFSPALLMSMSGGVTVTNVGGCTVNSPNVALPTLGVRALSSTGATAGRTGFVLSLNCNTTATSIKLRLTDQFNSSNVGNALQNSVSSGAAANVGIQLLDAGGNVITLGMANVITPAKSGSTNLKYFAQYLATATPVTAGKITAFAAIDLFFN